MVRVKKKIIIHLCPLDSMSEINYQGEKAPCLRIEQATPGLQIRCSPYLVNPADQKLLTQAIFYQGIMYRWVHFMFILEVSRVVLEIIINA